MPTYIEATPRAQQWKPSARAKSVRLTTRNRVDLSELIAQENGDDEHEPVNQRSVWTHIWHQPRLS